MDFKQYFEKKTSFLNIMKAYINDYANYLSNNDLTKLYIQARHHSASIPKKRFHDFLKNNEAKTKSSYGKKDDKVHKLSKSLHEVNSKGFAFGYDLLKNKTLNSYANGGDAVPGVIGKNFSTNELKSSAKAVVKRLNRNPNGFYDYILEGSKDSKVHAHLITPDDLLRYLDDPKNTEVYLDY